MCMVESDGGEEMVLRWTMEYTRERNGSLRLPSSHHFPVKKAKDVSHNILRDRDRDSHH